MQAEDAAIDGKFASARSLLDDALHDESPPRQVGAPSGSSVVDGAPHGPGARRDDPATRNRGAASESLSRLQGAAQATGSLGDRPPSPVVDASSLHSHTPRYPRSATGTRPAEPVQKDQT